MHQQQCQEVRGAWLLFSMQLCNALPTSRFELHIDTRQVHTSSDNTDRRQTFPVKLDPSFGSFSFNFTIPHDSGPGSVDLSLDWRADGEDPRHPYPQQVAWSSVQVALPRPPTAVLTLAPLAEAVKVGETASVRVLVKSYLGAPQAGLPVRLRWSLQCGPSRKAPGRGYAGAHPRPWMAKWGGHAGWLAESSVSSPALIDQGAEGGSGSGCPSEGHNGPEKAIETASRAVSRSCEGGVVDVITGEDGTALLDLRVSRDLLPPDSPGPEAWQASAAPASTSVRARARSCHPASSSPAPSRLVWACDHEPLVVGLKGCCGGGIFVRAGPGMGSGFGCVCCGPHGGAPACLVRHSCWAYACRALLLPQHAGPHPRPALQRPSCGAAPGGASCRGGVFLPRADRQRGSSSSFRPAADSRGDIHPGAHRMGPAACT